ncbi:MAG: N-acetylmuramoyl-L-alanine amidase [Sulfitobacter sp.]
MARWHPSPNFGPRRDGLTPSLIVLHYTAMASEQAAIERLCDPASEVSAHYLIAADGCVTQMVEERARAWHAGAGEWHGQSDINSRSIGIELDNAGHHPFSDPQMSALEHLLSHLMAQWNIPASGVIGHSDMAPGRKTDPGPHFDWERLARQGLADRAGLDPQPRDGDMEMFRKLAAHHGYTADASEEAVLHAVRLRFRPYVTGPLTPEDFSPFGPASLQT